MATRVQPARSFGATGVTVPLLGYGTAPLGKDTSPDYGSEPHVGAVMRTRRHEVFLATKVNRRSKEGVLAELKESLEHLQADHVDLIQVHAVNAWADLEQGLRNANNWLRMSAHW